MYKKNAVHGLTTAAGVWATAGIGMACGAGLYFVAVGGAAIMISVQCVLHINCKLFNSKRTYTIKISFIQTKDENQKIKEIFQVEHFHKLSVVRGEQTIFNVSIFTEKEIASDVIDEIMKNNDFIISIERCDD